MVNLTGNLGNASTFIIFAITILLFLRLVGSILFIVRQHVIEIWTTGCAWWCTCCKCPWQSQKVHSLKRFRRQVNDDQAPQMVIDCSNLDEVASEASDTEAGQTFLVDADYEDKMSDHGRHSTPSNDEVEKTGVQVSTRGLESSVVHDVKEKSNSSPVSSVPGLWNDRHVRGQTEETSEVDSKVSIGDLLKEAEEAADNVSVTLNSRQTDSWEV